MNLSAPDSVFFFLFIFVFFSSGFRLGLCCKTEEQPELRGRRDPRSCAHALKGKNKKVKEEFLLKMTKNSHAEAAAGSQL